MHVRFDLALLKRDGAGRSAIARFAKWVRYFCEDYTYAGMLN